MKLLNLPPLDTCVIMYTTMTTTTRTHQPELSERQRNFTNLLFQGVNHTQAYLTVYGPVNNAHSMGSRLSKNVKVQEELQRLRAQIEPEMVMSRQELAQITTDIAKNSQNETTRLKAGHLLAQLLGYYAPAKSESKELVRFLVEYRNREAVIPLASVSQPLLDTPRLMTVPTIAGQAIQLPERTSECVSQAME